MNAPHSLRSGALGVELDTTRGGGIATICGSSGENVLYWSDGFGRRLLDRSQTESQQRWLVPYSGGWDELMPNPGVDRTLNGQDSGFHGSLQSSDFSIGQITPEMVVGSATIRDQVRIERTVTLDPQRSTVSSKTAVHALRDVFLGWAHHIVLAASPNAIIEVGCPRVEEDIHRFLVKCSVDEQQLWSIPAPAAGCVLFARTEQESPSRIGWPKSIWPYLWIWAGNDEGRRYLAVEPSNRPDPHSISDTDLELLAGSYVEATISFGVGG